MSETMTKIHDAEDENVDGEKGGLKMTPSDNIFLKLIKDKGPYS